VSWLRIEGRMPHHRKVAPLSDAAFRLHVTASAWCVEERTNGLVPVKVPATLPAAPRGKALAKVLTELVEAGLWDEVAGGHAIHDFLKYNPTAEEAEAMRQAKAAAGALGGKRSAATRASKRQACASAGGQAGAQPSAQANEQQNSSPIPIPIPIPIPGEAAAAIDSDRERPLSPDFQLHPLAVAELAKALKRPEAVILEAVREFVAYWTIGGGANKPRAHWQAKCRDDIRRKHDRGELDAIAKRIGERSIAAKDDTGGFGKRSEWLT